MFKNIDHYSHGPFKKMSNVEENKTLTSRSMPHGGVVHFSVRMDSMHNTKFTTISCITERIGDELYLRISYPVQYFDATQPIGGQYPHKLESVIIAPGQTHNVTGYNSVTDRATISWSGTIATCTYPIHASYHATMFVYGSVFKEPE